MFQGFPTCLNNFCYRLFYYFVQYLLCVCYLTCFACLFAVFYPMVFLLPAEIFPLRHRSRSITVSLFLGRAAVLGFGRLPISTALQAVWVCLGVCVLALGFYYIALPETAGICYYWWDFASSLIGVLFSEMDSLFSVEEGEACCGVCPLHSADGYIGEKNASNCYITNALVGWRVMSLNPADPPTWLAYRSRPSFASDTSAVSAVSRSNEKRTMGTYSANRMLMCWIFIGKKRVSGAGKKGILSYQHSSPFTYSASSLRFGVVIVVFWSITDQTIVVRALIKATNIASSYEIVPFNI